jgi:ribosomal protein L28
LIEQKFFLESEGRWVRMRVSARALRTIKKLGGIEKAIRKYSKKNKG